MILKLKSIILYGINKFYQVSHIEMNKSLFNITTASPAMIGHVTVVIGEKNINAKLVFRHRRPFMPRV